jgi:hypothetical protein
MKLLIMQVYPDHCFFLHVRSNNPPRHPQFTFSPYCERPSYTHRQTDRQETGKIIIFVLMFTFSEMRCEGKTNSSELNSNKNLPNFISS